MIKKPMARIYLGSLVILALLTLLTPTDFLSVKEKLKSADSLTVTRVSAAMKELVRSNEARAFVPTILAASARQPGLPPEVIQAVEAKHYEIRRNEGARALGVYQALNPANGIRASFSRKGFVVTPQAASAKPWQ